MHGGDGPRSPEPPFPTGLCVPYLGDFGQVPQTNAGISPSKRLGSKGQWLWAGGGGSHY
jgi:hypothetical protein